MLDTVNIENTIKVLPPLSASAGQLLTVMAKQDRKIQEIVSVIEHDSALTASILRMVNSAAFGLRREIATIKEAVTLLGDTKITSLALASLGDGLMNKELQGYQGSRGDLGRHCLYTALVARELARHTRGRVDPGVAFTAGLLHDLGKAIISDFLVDRLDPLIHLLQTAGTADHLDAEKELLGTDHCDTGYELANHWHLPFVLRVGIKYHHLPAFALGDEKPMVYTIHLADHLTMRHGHGTGIDSELYRLDSGYLEFVKLSLDELTAVPGLVEKEFLKTAAVLYND
ncbi:MAG: HDOD domain-containing protein [bacterium]